MNATCSLHLAHEASIFARKWHGSQVRNNKVQEPYILHLAEVAFLVREAGGSEIEIASAWLHDVVEDTGADIADVREYFGPQVAEIVGNLTDSSTMAKMSLLKRKTMQAKRVRDKSRSVKIVKIADQTSNLRCVVVDPPVNWSKQKCIDYIVGAHRIWVSCRGLNDYLDGKFWEAYTEACSFYDLKPIC